MSNSFYNRDRLNRRRKKRGVSGTLALPVFAFGLVAAVIVGVSVAYNFGTEQSQLCTVTSKDRTTNSEGQSDMRIYTEECGVLKVADNFFRLQFNSADIYASLKEGETYNFHTYGWRIGLLSAFPTVIEVEK